MSVLLNGFIPERIAEARAARRIPSMSALARAMSLNPSTVSRWEDGTSAPDAETLASLASFLGVRPEFFLRPLNYSDRPTFLRSLASTQARDLKYQSTQMRWLQEVSHALEHYVDFPEVDIPDVMSGTRYSQLRDEDLERIALDLRRYWGLGEGPCGDMVTHLERIGCIVSTIEIGTAKLDGLCSWSPIDGRPFILLATDKMSFARRQMDAAHEMAHAILHRDVSELELKKDLKLIEAQAFRLAGAFLLPSTTFPVEMKNPSLSAMVIAKERWRVSIKAQIRRLVQLNCIPDDMGTHFYKLYSAKGWSREEPFDRVWKPSVPRVLSDAIHLIVDGGVRSKADLLALEFAISAGDVENLAGLEPGWFGRQEATVIQLKPSIERGGVGIGEVIDFPKRS
jgi:Zn-dependent peptidase ImmA (M78 family)/transcriptional regulator with XRE-family HTH domain